MEQVHKLIMKYMDLCSGFSTLWDYVYVSSKLYSSLVKQIIEFLQLKLHIFKFTEQDTNILCSSVKYPFCFIDLSQVSSLCLKSHTQNGRTVTYVNDLLGQSESCGSVTIEQG